MEQETNELRKKLRSSQSVVPEPSPIAMLTAAAEMDQEAATNVPDYNLTPQSQSPSLSQHHPLPRSISLGPTLPRIEAGPGDRLSDPTVPRVLNNVTVVGEEIDEIFELCVLSLAPYPAAVNSQPVQFFPAVCPIRSYTRPAGYTKRVLRSMPAHLLGCNRYSLPDIPKEPDFVRRLSA